jgi:hypothetical protein
MRQKKDSLYNIGRDKHIRAVQISNRKKSVQMLL